MSEFAFNPFAGCLQLYPSTTVKSYGHFLWNNDVTDAGGGAVKEVEFDMDIFKFSQGLEQCVRARTKAPSDYNSGQIKLFVSCYSESVINNFLVQSTSWLIRNNTDAINSVVNSRQSTNVFLPNPVVAYEKRTIILDLTDSSGKINGVLVNPNDSIEVRLKRITIAGDDVKDIRILPYAEVLIS